VRESTLWRDYASLLRQYRALLIQNWSLSIDGRARSIEYEYVGGEMVLFSESTVPPKRL